MGPGVRRDNPRRVLHEILCPPSAFKIGRADLATVDVEIDAFHQRVVLGHHQVFARGHAGEKPVVLKGARHLFANLEILKSFSRSSWARVLSGRGSSNFFNFGPAQ
jgi:hypothetical protein